MRDGDGKWVSSSGGAYETDVKGLYEYRMDLVEGTAVPETLYFTIRYMGGFSAGFEVSRAEYVLHPDMRYAKIVESHPVSAQVELCGQRVYIDRIDVYPTQSKLFFSTDPANDKILEEIDITLYDETGKAYPQRSGGVIGTFAGKDSELNSRWYESSYFARAKSLTAVITSVSFLDKSAQYGGIDYANRTIEHLPEGVSVAAMTLDARRELKIALKVPKDMSRLPTASAYRKAEGTGAGEYVDSGYTVWSSYWSEEMNEEICPEEEGYQYQVFSISNYEEGAYELQWYLPTRNKLAEPLSIPLF